MMIDEENRIVRFPRTPEGRQALREALFMLRNVGPPPDGSKVSEIDWDQFVVECECAEIARLEMNR